MTAARLKFEIPSNAGRSLYNLIKNMKFDEVINLIEQKYTKPYNYVGNCSDSFNSKDGSCPSGIFRDVSDFAMYDEQAENTENNSGYMSFDDFDSLVNIPEWINVHTGDYEFMYYGNGILVAYDTIKDIHYFFGK